VTVQTRHGLLTIDTADRYIARSLYCKGEFELDLMLRTAAHLRSIGAIPAKGTGTLLDLGANMGVTSVGMLTHDEFDRAIAIEPAPRNFELLQRNVRQNGLDRRVVCLPLAVSDRSGTVSFELSDTNFGDHRVRLEGGTKHEELDRESDRRVISVPSRPIDEMLAALPREFTDPLALVWMDVQGFEGFAIRGGASLFADAPPVMTEVWPYGIRRSGMAIAEFVALVQSHWSRFWRLRGPRGDRHFASHPISAFSTVVDELGLGGAYDNILLTR